MLTHLFVPPTIIYKHTICKKTDRGINSLYEPTLVWVRFCFYVWALIHEIGLLIFLDIEHCWELTYFFNE